MNALGHDAPQDRRNTVGIFDSRPANPKSGSIIQARRTYRQRLLRCWSHAAAVYARATLPQEAAPDWLPRGRRALHGLVMVTADPAPLGVWLAAAEYVLSGAATFVTVTVTDERP